MEKNWRKIISRRHVREVQETEAAEADAAATDEVQESDSAAPTEQQPTASSSSTSDSLAATTTASAPSSGSSNGQPSTENGARKPKSETAPDSETVALAKRQLEVRHLPFGAHSRNLVTSSARSRIRFSFNRALGARSEAPDARGRETRQVRAAQEHSRRRSAVEEQHTDASRLCHSHSDSSRSREEAPCRVQRQRWDCCVSDRSECFGGVWIVASAGNKHNISSKCRIHSLSSASERVVATASASCITQGGWLSKLRNQTRSTTCTKRSTRS